MPIVIHWDGSPSNNLSNAEAVAAVQAAIDQWTSIPCTQLSFDATQPPVPVTSTSSNHLSFEQAIDLEPEGPSRVTFDDPGDDLAPLILAATLVEHDSSTPAQTLNGQQFLRISAFQILFARNWQWVTRAQDQAEQCQNQFDIQSVAVHELGHGLGYAHSCEAGESCLDSEMLHSIMYWRQGFCEQLQPNAYDANQDAVAYGFGGISDFTAAVRSGPLPLTVDFVALPVEVGTTATIVQSASWQFGDGATSTSISPSHVYETEGQYPVNLQLTAFSPTCGPVAFTQDVTKENYVTACKSLVPFFTSRSSGNTVHFASTTPGATSGCLTSLAWDFGDGTLGFTEQPIHHYAKPGTYTVSLTAAGPAGIAGPFVVPISVGESGGCSVENVRSETQGLPALSTLLLVAIALAARRQRA